MVFVKKALSALVFFIGWILSPFTWWNDAFINIPLSYLLANAIFRVSRLPFKWLVLGLYWISNVLGIFFMYFGGKKFIMKSRDRIRAAAILAVMVILYSLIMLYLDQKGHLKPLEEYFGKVCVDIKEKD